MGTVGGVRPVDERPEVVEIDLDELVVQRAVVWTEVGGHLVCRVGDAFSTGCLEVHGHVLVIGEQRAGGADLGTHVAHGCLAGCRDAVRAGAEVLDDRAGSALYREHACDLEDDVLRGRPAGQRSGELHADDLGPLHVEREARHDVDRVCAADADGHHPETAGVGGVAVGADHHPAGEAVVLEHHLVNDPAAGAPEADAVLGGHAAQEVVHLAVVVDGDAHIDLGADLRRDEVVTVHCGRNSGGG